MTFKEKTLYVDRLLASAKLLGDDITDAQAERLMDKARVLSVAEREVLIANTDSEKFFNLLSENRYESRWEVL